MLGLFLGCFALAVANDPPSSAGAQSDEDLAPPPGAPGDELAPPPGPAEDDLAPPPNPRPETKPPKANDWAAWAGVKEIRGFNSVSDVFEMKRDSGVLQEAARHTMLADLKFRLVRDDEGEWRMVEGEVSGSDNETHSTSSWNYQGSDSSSADISGKVADVSFTLSTKYGKWEFGTGGRTIEEYTVQHQLKAHAFRDLKWEDEASSSTQKSKTYRHIGMHGTLPSGKPTTITASQTTPYGNQENGTTEELRSTLVLTPVYEDVELVVELSGPGRGGRDVSYDQWIPAGTFSGGVGSRLGVKARLETPAGKPSKLEVKELAFRLSDTSREPGVCMNYPLNAAKAGKPAAPDLRFVPAGGQNGKDRQEKFLPAAPDKDGYLSAETTIECVDWGAWATLVVEATLEDGRVVTGHLKGDPATIAIQLPKRTAGSRIADAWKQARGLAVSADDYGDDENDPVGDGTTGDGLTLYEEYRGFAEAGSYVEGDPKKKDLFVHLHNAGIAAAGAAKFQRITLLKVHYKLTHAEFPVSRIINANHDRGPHLTDQHGVRVRIKAGQKGFAQADGGPGNPKMVKSVDLPEDIASLDAHECAVTVAHELGHCVNIWHHGEADDGTVTWTLVGESLAESSPRGGTVLVNGVITGATPNTVTLVRDETLMDLTAWVHQVVAASGKLSLWKAEDHGQHSGFENCVMRYDCAQIYKDKAAMSYRFWVRAEPVGDALCKSGTGTGVNENGRTPQSRYGDAAAGRGDCAQQILVSDAVTARSRLNP